MNHVRRVHRDVTLWRRSVKVKDESRPLTGQSLMPRFPTTKKERKKLPTEFMTPRPSTNVKDEQTGPSIDRPPDGGDEGVLAFVALVNQQPGSHMTKTETESLWNPPSQSGPQTFLNYHDRHQLLPPDALTLPMFIENHVLVPLLAHAKLISTNLVTVYLEDLDLLDHLDVLRSFFLAGDIGFTERVCGALFGKEEAGAGEALGMGRRARTRARMGLNLDAQHGYPQQPGERDADKGDWGIGLGLGLSERNQWPPGGAELAYALRTTLLNDDTRDGKGPVWQGIEDRVSFAVKDLPQANDGRKPRWMDPQAIEALDFLYLSYSPPAVIRHLLPTSLMAKYQLLNSYLLRLGRVDTVLRSMYVNTAHPRSAVVIPPKIGVDSRTKLATTVAGTTRTAHSTFPGQPQAEHLLHCLRHRMTIFVSTLTRYTIDTAINAKWNVMRKRLAKLRQKAPDKPQSQPMTPSEDLFGSYDSHDDRSSVVQTETEDDEDEFRTAAYIQLQSIHSLVAYHQMTMDRILRSALLSQTSNGQKSTFKILMTLAGLVLDLGKTVKQVEMEVVDEQKAAEAVMQIGASWDKHETAFVSRLFIPSDERFIDANFSCTRSRYCHCGLSLPTTQTSSKGEMTTVTCSC